MHLACTFVFFLLLHKMYVFSHAVFYERAADTVRLSTKAMMNVSRL